MGPEKPGNPALNNIDTSEHSPDIYYNTNHQKFSLYFIFKLGYQAVVVFHVDKNLPFSDSGATEIIRHMKSKFRVVPS